MEDMLEEPEKFPGDHQKFEEIRAICDDHVEFYQRNVEKMEEIAPRR